MPDGLGRMIAYEVDKLLEVGFFGVKGSHFYVF